MKKNETSYNIDKEHDEIKIGLNIYNNTTYDILNKRDRLTKATIEIELSNVSKNAIEIFSPHLSIESKNVVTTYCSQALVKQYPIQLKPLKAVKIPFDSNNFHHLLNQQTDEIVRIFVYDNFNKMYTSFNIVGDALEDIIQDKNIMTIFRAETIYQFDTITKTQTIEVPTKTETSQKHCSSKYPKHPTAKMGFFKKLKSIFIID